MQNPPPSVSNTILFIDDEAMARKYFARLFGRNRKVMTAADGREGLDMFTRHRDEIGLVITDHIMPQMTGIEFLESLGGENARVIRILSTAHTDSDLVRSAVDNGLIDYFIGKPWNLQKFESILEQSFSLLDHRPPEVEGC